MIENFEKLTGYFSFVSLKQVDITPYVDLIPKGVGFMFCGIVLYLFLSISKNKASVFVSQRRAKNRYMELAVVNKSGIVLDLEELSQLWVDDRKKQLYSKLANNDALDIEDMSFIWRTPLQAEDKSFIPTFKYGRSQAFFEEYIQSSIAFETGPVHRSACIRLIQTIEEYGDYPSVVNIYDKNKTLKANRKVTDHDVTLDESTFSLLANVSLLDHSIDVCEKAFELLKDREAVHVAPDCFIACLGHDLGKLPPAHSTFYSMHDHASCASKLLSRIEELNLLPRINEIFSAIKCHHKSVKGLLAEVLQEADQRARADEVECVASGVYEYAQVICDSPVYVDPRVEKSGLKPAASITEQILIEAQNQSNTIEKGDSTSAPKEGMATVIPMSEQTSKSDSSQQKEKDTGAEEKKIEKVSKVKPEDRQTKEGNTGKDEGETIVFKNEKKRRRSGKKKQGEVKSEETKNQQTIRIEPDTDKTKTETQAKNNEEVKSIDLEEVVPLVAQKKQGTTQELPPQDQTQPCNAGHEVDAGYVEALMSGPHEPITDYGEPEVIIEGKTVSNEQQGQICLDVEIEEQIVSSKASPQELEPAQKKDRQKNQNQNRKRLPLQREQKIVQEPSRQPQQTTVVFFFQSK